jgi:hypothetical protein
VDLYKANLLGANLHKADLTMADLGATDLTIANLSEADLSEARLQLATLTSASLLKANLSRARLEGAVFADADLSEADLRRADLSRADFREARLNGTDLRGADLSEATFVDTDLTGADLTGCRVYGVSAWGLKLSEDTKQQSLIITPENEPEITTDNIEVAQFIYLLLHNEKLQRVIDTITTKVVLILGRFSLPERKAVLDTLRDELRKPGRSYVPVVFDFKNPKSQTTVNTITLLARMARFVIADVSDAKSVLLELQAIVPNSPKLPVQPIIVAAQEEPGMFDSFEPYPWFLKICRYDDLAQLLTHLDEWVISPAEAKVAKLRPDLVAPPRNLRTTP